MTIFSIILLSSSYLQSTWLLNYFISISIPLQNFCNNLYFADLHHVSLYRAVACGLPPSPQIYEPLKMVSLWHLLVVSGGHFSALSFLLKKIKFLPVTFIHLLLLFFCFWTGFQEPAIFAWFIGLGRFVSEKLSLKIPQENLLLLSGSLCILLFPSWSLSLSLILSWICHVSLLFIANIKSKLVQGCCFFLFLLPVFSSFSMVSPQSILWNTLLSPILSFILFPLSIGIIFSPFLLGNWTDYFLDAFLKFILLFQTPSATDSNIHHFKINPLIFWQYLFLLHLIYFFKKQYQIYQNRK